MNMNITKVKWRLLCIATLLFVLPLSLYAHTINYALERAPTKDVSWFYIKLGYNHIIPQGLDHILFVVGLCLLGNNLKTIIWQATAFTVAHSITLAMSMKSIIIAPSAVVEPIIALSILFIAIENVLIKELKPWRIFLVFMFGLIHGLGFASSLNEIGLPRNQFALSILSFNVGVELGQISIILAVFFLIIKPFANRLNYRKQIVFPLSVIIGLIAAVWTVQRIVLL